MTKPLTLLQSLREPITVQLARKQSGDPVEPLFIPARNPDTGAEDWQGTPGANWRKDDVAQLERWAKECFGGGLFVATVVDADKTKLQWKFGIEGNAKGTRRHQ